MRLHLTLQMWDGGVEGEATCPGSHGRVGVGPDAPPAVSSRERWAALLHRGWFCPSAGLGSKAEQQETLPIPTSLN